MLMTMRSSSEVRLKVALDEAEAAGASPEWLSTIRGWYFASKRGDKQAMDRILARAEEINLRPGSLLQKRDPAGWAWERRRRAVEKAPGNITEATLDPGQILEAAIDDERKSAWRDYGEQIPRTEAMRRLMKKSPQLFTAAQMAYR